MVVVMEAVVVVAMAVAGMMPLMFGRREMKLNETRKKLMLV